MELLPQQQYNLHGHCAVTMETLDEAFPLSLQSQHLVSVSCQLHQSLITVIWWDARTWPCFQLKNWHKAYTHLTLLLLIPEWENRNLDGEIWEQLEKFDYHPVGKIIWKIMWKSLLNHNFVILGYLEENTITISLFQAWGKTGKTWCALPQFSLAWDKCGKIK